MQISWQVAALHGLQCVARYKVFLPKQSGTQAALCILCYKLVHDNLQAMFHFVSIDHSLTLKLNKPTNKVYVCGTK